MIMFQSYRLHLFGMLVIFLAFAYCNNVFCAYADFKQGAVNIAEPEPAEDDVVEPQAQNTPRLHPITWYVGLHQPDAQRRYDIELYPTKKSCCALLGLIAFITIMALRLRSMHHDQPAPSIWQEDGCLPGCRSAFNASGALVNASSEYFWSWRPWIIGCNGDTRPLAGPYDYCGSQGAYSTRACRAYRNQTLWNPADVSKEKMIAEISSYCKTYEHIAFCHCDWDWDKEGNCDLNPLDIVSRLKRNPDCKPPQASIDLSGNRGAMSLGDRLKERLKSLRDKRMNNSSHVLRTKNNVMKHAIKQPRQRSKR